MAAAQGKMEELKKRILYTIFMLCVFRVASQIPTPGVNRTALMAFFEGHKGGIFGMLSTFSGGALERFSVVALGIMPYISSSIIFSLLTATFPRLAEIQKEPDGYKKINKWTRYLTVVLCIIQGTGLSTQLQGANSPGGTPVVLNPGMLFVVVSVITLTAGTMFVMWLGEQITERGIGNGISLIIFAGIAAGIPTGTFNTIRLFRNGQLSGFTLLLVGLVIFATFWIIIYIERAFRKVPIQYAKKVIHNRVYGGQSTHLPIKINIAGVIPPIFAYSLLAFPLTIGNFVPDGNPIKPYIQTIINSLSPGQVLYNVVFVGMIIFFAYFYVPIQFKTEDISENLKKNGGFIPGIRPGSKTKEFFDFIVNRLTLAGATYVALICVLPTMLSTKANIPFYFGGTSLLILVGVAIDTMEKIQSFMISQRYDTAYKARGKHSGAKRF
ncbi:MAG: preprotein translocase subunit SecY [Bacteriovoracaceae bacterium]|jgi:preprotein translocase subunit SecY|nr:preprotein translocase subunit SecY [Bacteriovoracaceae bacterium]